MSDINPDHAHGLRNEGIVAFNSELAKAAGFMNPQEALIKGVCCKCQQPAADRCSTAAGRREYQISAMCEVCFDALFDDGDSCVPADFARDRDRDNDDPIGGFDFGDNETDNDEDYDPLPRD